MTKFKLGDKVRLKDQVGGYPQSDFSQVFAYGVGGDWDYTINEYEDDFELVEENKLHHVHYDLIMKWAANPSGVVVEYFDNVDMCWKYIEKPTWVSSCQYRFKPEEPERVFPTTSLTKSEIFSIFTTNNGVKDLDAGLKAVADGAIMRYIRDEEEE